MEAVLSINLYFVYSNSIDPKGEEVSSDTMVYTVYMTESGPEQLRPDRQIIKNLFTKGPDNLTPEELVMVKNEARRDLDIVLQDFLERKSRKNSQNP